MGKLIKKKSMSSVFVRIAVVLLIMIAVMQMHMIQADALTLSSHGTTITTNKGTIGKVTGDAAKNATKNDEDDSSSYSSYLDVGVEIVVYGSKLIKKYGWLLIFILLIMSLITTETTRERFRKATVVCLIIWLVCIVLQYKSGAAFRNTVDTIIRFFET
jgi:hypothetical protein